MELHDTVIEHLKKVYDPELGINVYDLGLIYDVKQINTNVSITMTLTTPGCPLHDSITSAVKNAISMIDGVQEVTIELVWEPAWSPAMMSRDAKAQLGHSM